MSDLQLKLDLACKLNSGAYVLTTISRETGISPYWLRDIRDNAQDTKAPKPMITSLDVYFKNLQSN